LTQLNPDPNPYVPPQTSVADATRTPKIKPRSITWAVTALWVSYGLAFMHAAIVIGDRWIVWPPENVVLIQLASELFYAALIYYLSSGRNWARLIYTVLLGLRTGNVIWYFPDDWQSSQGLVLVTALSFSLQYMAMVWLYTETGRHWFKRSQAD
jgi:hypothetical protein